MARVRSVHQWQTQCLALKESGKGDNTSMAWIPIQYRDFYDIPRAFIVEHQGALFFFDGSFDEKADEYREQFRVFRLGPESSKIVQSDSWVGLEKTGTLIAEVPVSSVKFDATRRAAVDDSVFDRF
jgi:hypothetical protein